MYSPKRRFRLFRDPAWAENTITDTTVYTYTWAQQSGAPGQRYAMIDIDDTGNTMVSTQWTSTPGAQGPYVSTDKGATWTRKVTGITLSGGVTNTHSVCVARSSPLIMYTTTYPSGSIFKSTDGGDNWTNVGPLSGNWYGVKCNSTGSIVVAALNLSYLYKSTDGGATWTAMTGSGTGVQLDSVFVSDDGLVIVGCQTPGNLRVSRDGGAIWSSVTTVGLNRLWRGISGSADGRVLFACSSGAGGRPVFSTDYGVTWSAISVGSAVVSWWNTAVSINGNKLLTAQGDGYIYISQDGGANWTQFTSSPGTTAQSWEGVAMTSDGKTLVVGTQGTGKPWVGIGV